MALRTVLEIQSEKDHEIRCAEEMMEKVAKLGRVCNEDEQRDVDDRIKKAKVLQGEIEEVQAHEQRALNVRNAVEQLRKPGERVTAAAQIDVENRYESKPRIEVPSYAKRYGALKAFKGQDGERDAFTSGQWLRAMFWNDYRAQKWCQENGIPVIRNILGGDALGGGSALVPEQLSQAIIDLREMYGVFRQYADVTQMASDVMKIPRWASQLTASFVAENPSAANSTTDPAFDAAELIAHKLWCSTLMSVEIAEDAIINLADKLAQKFGEAFAHKEDQAGFTGDASQNYGGAYGVMNFFTDNNTFTGAVGAASGHHVFTTIDNTDLAVLMAALPQYAHRNAAFYCSQAFNDAVFQRLAAVAGGNTVQGLSGKFEPAYLGYPIRISQVLPAGVATDYTNKSMCLFGRLDLSSTLGERRGMTVSLTDQRYWELDQIGIKATERISIVNHDLGNSTTAGPIVALIGK